MKPPNCRSEAETGSTPNNYPLHLGLWMLGGLAPLFLAIGLILLHVLTDKEK